MPNAGGEVLSNQAPARLCPRCGRNGHLPRPEEALELAEALPVPAVLRACDAVLAARLERCASCDALREKIICAHCGCFVQFRARIKDGYCPRPGGSRWEA